MLVFLLTINVTLLLSILFESPLEEAANPFLTPNPAKAPWYFLWLQELVAITTIRIGNFSISGGLIGGILLPGVLLAAAACWPFFDRSPAAAEGKWFARERQTQNFVFAVIFLAIVALILIGVFVRGPYWKLYMPWQEWPQLPRHL
jgi:quinol-cytochrome oxidoreductase complex cytochrome b subunit